MARAEDPRSGSEADRRRWASDADHASSGRRPRLAARAPVVTSGFRASSDMAEHGDVLFLPLQRGRTQYVGRRHPGLCFVEFGLGQQPAHGRMEIHSASLAVDKDTVSKATPDKAFCQTTLRVAKIGGP